MKSNHMCTFHSRLVAEILNIGDGYKKSMTYGNDLELQKPWLKVSAN